MVPPSLRVPVPPPPAPPPMPAVRDPAQVGRINSSMGRRQKTSGALLPLSPRWPVVVVAADACIEIANKLE